jgi:hypothetical protein
LAIFSPTYAVRGKNKSEVIGAGEDRERVRARDATCRSIARVESRLGVDRGIRKFVSGIVATVENSKYQA